MHKQNNQYIAELIIDVEKQYLSANVIFNYHSPSNTLLQNKLKFYIHKDLMIEKIICERPMTYIVEENVSEWCPFILESKLIIINFSEPINTVYSIKLNFKYQGNIGIVTQYGVNRITKEWVELGMYTPWFPIIESLEAALFNVNIRIADGYKVINSKKIGDTLVLNQTMPSMDCNIIASNQFYNFKKDVANIKINTYIIDHKHRELAENIANYSKLILDKYFNFGKIDDRNLSIAILPRKDGGGYCRPNLIVLTADDNLDDEIGYFKYIAHELAHLWWCKAINSNSWEDWLNESFAEYSALLTLRDIFGEDEFNSKINKYKFKSEGLPPIKGINRDHEKAYEVLYIKGPLLLYELEKTIGNEKFVELLHITHIDEIDSTEMFLSRLGEITNQKIEDDFSKLLSI